MKGGLAKNRWYIRCSKVRVRLPLLGIGEIKMVRVRRARVYRPSIYSLNVQCARACQTLASFGHCYAIVVLKDKLWNIAGGYFFLHRSYLRGYNFEVTTT